MEMIRRRPQGGPDGTQKSGRAGPLSDAELFDVHGRASELVTRAGEISEGVAAALAKSKTNVDSLTERARMLGARIEGLAFAVRRIDESLERLGVVALNAGLEGARNSDAHGRGLSLLSEEIRTHVTRATEATTELRDLTTELAAEAGEVMRRSEEAKADITSSGGEAGRARATAADAERLVSELGERLRKATGLDPRTAETIQTAADHARGLVDALAAIDGAAAPLAASALAPLLKPLTKLLESLVANEPAGDGDDGSDK